MDRRQFLIGTAASVGTLVGSGEPGSQAPALSERTYHLLGVPLRTGSLYPGNETDAQSYRDARLITRLEAVGCKVVDDGDLAIPSYLPHHSIPPIRSWPGPRIVWDLTAERIAPYLQRSGSIPLLIGCDCSVVVGTTQALLKTAGENLHVLYIDGDFDDAAPTAARCQSAASLAVWFLTNNSPFWAGPALKPSQVTVIGWTKPSQSGQAGMPSVSSADLQRIGPRQSAMDALKAIPPSASTLVHLDIDVLSKHEMPAAYFPHDDGLRLSECGELLRVLVQDARVRIIEVSEYAALRDPDQHYAGKLVELIVEALKA